MEVSDLCPCHSAQGNHPQTLGEGAVQQGTRRNDVHSSAVESWGLGSGEASSGVGNTNTRFMIQKTEPIGGHRPQ